MLLDVRITDFDTLKLPVTSEEVADYKARHTPALDDIQTYLCGKDNLLDADRIAERLFSVTPADVFLSHAHLDQDAVVALAVRLERLGLKVFVDSCVWGDVYALLLEVDKAHAAVEGKEDLFHYTQVTRNAASVYMILGVALQRMIDQSELLLFLDSPAVRVEDYVEGEDYIGSPWIFAELMFAQMVARRPRGGLGLEQFTEAVAKAEPGVGPVMRYRLPVSRHVMAAGKLRELMESAGIAQHLSRKLKVPCGGTDFLNAFYRALDLSEGELALLGWA